MEKVKIILNPSSGKQLTERKVDYLTKLLLDDGYTVAKFMTKKKDDAMKETIKTCNEDWDIIIACGGDGTVNEVAKGIAKSQRKVPVAILSTGTVNDFANYLNIPNNINDFFEMIKRRKIIDIDIGKTSNDYFVNVAAGGILTNVGYQVQPEAKALLGRMAYYFEGLIELVRQGLAPINVRFESEEYTSDEKILLFLISNSSSIGGFRKLAPDADVLDGLLDVLIIKNSDVPELANIFFNVLRGGHINHPNVIYFKTKSITIKSDKDIAIDIDGEYGGELPANFQVCSKAMKIFI
jgi:diacylglycerol kinase (ATP)